MPNSDGDNESLCPCGSELELSACCNRFLSGDSLPASAEELMRSRYSAFVLQNEAYLLGTWHPDTRPSRVRFDSEQRWLGLRIRETEQGAARDSIGYVEFVARFKINGKGHRLHERSRFEWWQDRWYYRDGQHL